MPATVFMLFRCVHPHIGSVCFQQSFQSAASMHGSACPGSWCVCVLFSCLLHKYLCLLMQWSRKLVAAVHLLPIPLSTLHIQKKPVLPVRCQTCSFRYEHFYKCLPRAKSGGCSEKIKNKQWKNEKNKVLVKPEGKQNGCSKVFASSGTDLCRRLLQDSTRWSLNTSSSPPERCLLNCGFFWSTLSWSLPALPSSGGCASTASPSSAGLPPQGSDYYQLC